MNNREIKDTERLVRRFFDGETTLAEERRLYRLFSRKGLPQELEKRGAGRGSCLLYGVPCAAWRLP